MKTKFARREFLKWSFVGTGALVLAACAPSAPPPAPTQAPKAQPTVAPPTEAPKKVAEVVKLRVMTRQGAAGEHMREFAKRFGEESGGKVVVEIEDTDFNAISTKLETQLVSDTMVDVAWGDQPWFPYLAKRGAFRLLDDYVQAANLDMSKWFNVPFFRRWTDGKLGGFGDVAGINHILAFYNKDWVKEAWGKEPTDDWTMDDYVDCMKACVKLKGKGTFGGNTAIGGGHVADGWIRNWGGFYMNAEGTKSLFAEDKCQLGIQWIRDQLKNGNYPGREDSAEGETKMFYSNKQAILISNPGAWTGMVSGAQQNKINLGVCLAPKGPSCFEATPRRAFIPYTAWYGVYAKSKAPQEAFNMILKLTSVECMKWMNKTNGKQPGARLEVWYDPDIVATSPYFPKVADLMKACTDVYPIPGNTRYNEWRDVGVNEIPPLIFGNVEYNKANVQKVNEHLQEVMDLPMPKAATK
jgi:ABC-type glycerol-3-phosphate transport system substrate-binding protein